MTHVDDLVEVVITAPDAAWLIGFTRRLVLERLAAAAHHHTIRSVYTWNGTLNDTAETRAALHTRAELVPAIISRTRAEHAYQVPGIIAIPLVAANPDYAAWIRDNTATAAELSRSRRRA